ncbi:uncharacterized protein UTRI_10019 [Ustilago trichophora]|uniref:Uncharacterized protein n=1 Tax=Ustilago trichophora TaxID=86804 RepID=A0A5C3DRZ2_9BASI|nr:uncharacterized protein UTRI_10019 [Ustilago trichophora]
MSGTHRSPSGQPPSSPSGADDDDPVPSLSSRLYDLISQENCGRASPSFHHSKYTRSTTLVIASHAFSTGYPSAMVEHIESLSRTLEPGHKGLSDKRAIPAAGSQQNVKYRENKNFFSASLRPNGQLSSLNQGEKVSLAWSENTTLGG